jgi:hypothetical protein
MPISLRWLNLIWSTQSLHCANPHMNNFISLKFYRKEFCTGSRPACLLRFRLLLKWHEKRMHCAS